jgi:hypothetical protein
LHCSPLRHHSMFPFFFKKKFPGWQAQGSLSISTNYVQHYIKMKVHIMCICGFG